MKKPKVLIACEESQAVAIEFRKLGVEAYSCDIIDCSGSHPKWHLKGDAIKEAYSGKYDMMIAFPPCTYLAICGLHYLKTKPERAEQHNKAVHFFKELYNSPINKIALENPIGWINTNWKKPTQIIQPYYFGDPEIKTTCLWLKNLPPLQYKLTNDLFGNKTSTDRPLPTGFVIRKSGKKKGQRYNYYFRQGKTAKNRSKTFPGIAKAMAEQWSKELY